MRRGAALRTGRCPCPADAKRRHSGSHKAPKAEKEERRGNHGATREHKKIANQRPRRSLRAARLRAVKPREHPDRKARNDETREELMGAMFFRKWQLVDQTNPATAATWAGPTEAANETAAARPTHGGGVRSSRADGTRRASGGRAGRQPQKERPLHFAAASWLNYVKKSVLMRKRSGSWHNYSHKPDFFASGAIKGEAVIETSKGDHKSVSRLLRQNRGSPPVRGGRSAASSRCPVWRNGSAGRSSPRP